MIDRDERTEEALHAAVISLLAEGIAVMMFIAMLLVWAAILGTRGA